MRLTKPGGRIGIILPNGYLGNRSPQYLALREWLLRYTKVVGIVGFPRFTFKKSGADVSASVVFLEKRKKPLARAADSTKYHLFVGVIESVGWRAGDKTVAPVYVRDEESGALILDAENNPMLDADFASLTNEFLRSAASNCFPWLLSERECPTGPQGWSISIDDVVSRNDLSLDPKRHCQKFVGLRNEIAKLEHFRLGDALEVVPPSKFKKKDSSIYRYVEIQNIGHGDFDFERQRGWQLPQRGKLPAKPGDFFIAHLWSSAGKWFMAPPDATDMVVTDGCARLRIKPGGEELLLDIVAGLCSETFRVQIRALATGSDGLAEIADNELLDVMLPRITDPAQRKRLKEYVNTVMQTDVRFSKAINQVIGEIADWPVPQDRKSHCALV